MYKRPTTVQRYSYAQDTGGFTLIELMTVIAIIGILASIVFASTSGARARGRDAERIAEVSELRLVLERFYATCGTYPPPTDASANDYTLSTSVTATGCPSGTTLGTFISNIPTDPNGSKYYFNITSNGKIYRLGATLESNNAVLVSDLDLDNNPTDTGAYVAYCQDSNLGYCIGP